MPSSEKEKLLSPFRIIIWIPSNRWDLIWKIAQSLDSINKQKNPIFMYHPKIVRLTISSSIEIGVFRVIIEKDRINLEGII
jgi:hypothetical protein